MENVEKAKPENSGSFKFGKYAKKKEIVALLFFEISKEIVEKFTNLYVF